jgi:transposase
MEHRLPLTGPERRRRWNGDDRRQILAAAFAPGAVVAAVSRQFDVSSSLIYKWLHQELAARQGVSFVPAVVQSPREPVAAAIELAAISVEFTNGTRLKIGAQASAALVTATLRALR